VKVGISIGVRLVALPAIFGLVVFCLRRKKKQQQSQYPLQEMPGSSMQQGEARQPSIKPLELYMNVPPAELENHQSNKD
jgi:hypothetical protein